MNLRPPPPPTDPVFGSLCPLKKSLPTQLPTYGDIGRAIGYELHKMDVGLEPGNGDHVYDHGAAFSLKCTIWPVSFLSVSGK